MILADKIVRLRKKNGWSQEELAQKMNVSRQAVSKWENGNTMPDVTMIPAIASFFGCFRFRAYARRVKPFDKRGAFSRINGFVVVCLNDKGFWILSGKVFDRRILVYKSIIEVFPE